MKDNKFYINCPYEEKDLAKALGANGTTTQENGMCDARNGVKATSLGSQIKLNTRQVT